MKQVTDFIKEFNKATEAGENKFTIEHYTFTVEKAKKLIELVRIEKIKQTDSFYSLLNIKRNLKQVQELVRLKYRKERAKSIAKLLRKNGVRTGVIRGNGTTSPLGADKFTAYFSIESCHDSSIHLYLNFKIDGKAGKTINKILKENDIDFTWKDGSEYNSFDFPVDYQELEKTWNVVI